jgi:hypothetical protein
MKRESPDPYAGTAVLVNDYQVRPEDLDEACAAVGGGFKPEHEPEFRQAIIEAVALYMSLEAHADTEPDSAAVFKEIATVRKQAEQLAANLRACHVYSLDLMQSMEASPAAIAAQLEALVLACDGVERGRKTDWPAEVFAERVADAVATHTAYTLHRGSDSGVAKVLKAVLPCIGIEARRATTLARNAVTKKRSGQQGQI